MRPYTVPPGERRTVVGGLIGHCVSPQPWREIDAHVPMVKVSYRVSDMVRNSDKVHLWLWRTLDIADQNLTKFGLVTD